jgi:hypothetical protein
VNGSKSTQPWPGSLEKLPHPSFIVADASDLDVSVLVEEQRRRYTLSETFGKVEKEVMEWIMPSADHVEHISHLRLLSRSFLTLASIIPFLLYLPFQLRKTRIDSYKLRLDVLRATLLELAKHHSTSVLQELEAEVDLHERLETSLAIQAIATRFAIPPNYDATTALPDLSTEDLHSAIMANANMIASISAFERLEALAKAITENKPFGL